MKLGLMESRPWRQALLVIALSVVVGGCDPDGLLDVEYPDYITEGAIETQSGAEALRVKAVGGFAELLNWGPALVIIDALWTDQLVSARPDFAWLDHRTAYPVSRDISYRDWANLHNQALRAITGMTEFFPDGPDKDSKIGHIYILDGLGMTLMAETYCNGIPLGEVVDGEMVFEDPLTYNELFERGLEQLDAALATLPSSATDLQSFALVAKGRTLLNLNRPSEAATAVASVPTDFEWDAEYGAPGAITSGIYDWITLYGNFGPANREGNGNYDSCDGTGQGLPYICEGDPRVRIETPAYRIGPDGSTRIYKLLDHLEPSSPITAASGIEARLIEAEAALRAGDSNWLTILNDLRATMITGLEPLADPGTEDARVDLLFKERAYWMFMTAHRTGDLRRLVRDYGRQATDVFPSGAYFKGGTYGTQYVLEPNEDERNRPEGAPPYDGCMNLDI